MYTPQVPCNSVSSLPSAGPFPHCSQSSSSQFPESANTVTLDALALEEETWVDDGWGSEA